MKTYIASKTKHAARWRMLRDMGGLNVTSTWIDEAGPGESKDVADLARRCVEEAKAADRLILYCEPGELHKGSLIEVGAALAAGVPVYCVGTCESLSDTFARHPLWTQCEDIWDALGKSYLALTT